MDDVEQGLKDQQKAYQKLKKIADSPEFKEFFDFQLKTVADKMLWAFTTGKDGDNIKTWDDFCKVRGEIVARLHPIQEVYGAEAMLKYLSNQLNTYYKQNI